MMNGMARANYEPGIFFLSPKWVFKKCMKLKFLKTFSNYRFLEFPGFW